MAAPHRILIVEDDANTAEMLDAYFSAQGYAIDTTSWGRDALRLCRASPPDLVIQDIHLPDIDGYEVVRALHENTRTSRIPVIFLTQRDARGHRIAGLSLGAVDYVSKPCDLQELRLRVQNALHRAGHRTLVDPVTGLPGREVVEAHIRDNLGRANLAIILVSLEGSEAFSETYGFVTGDDTLRAVGTILCHIAERAGAGDGVVGHVDASDFVIVTHRRAASQVRNEVAQRLSSAMPLFYPARDLALGHTLPKLRIRIGIALASNRRFDSPGAVLRAAAEAQQIVAPPQPVHARAAARAFSRASAGQSAPRPGSGS